MDLAKNPHSKRAFGSPDILHGKLFISYFVSIRGCEKQDLHRWIAEKADSHECLESLDGFLDARTWIAC
jgi:hypothetical protein